MDTLKKITPSRFSTLPTLCWTEKGILTSPRIISVLSCFSIWGSYFFQHTIFVTGNPVREHCLLPPRNDPSTVSAHFFQTFQEKSLDLHISVRLCIVPVPHLTVYCCWLDQQGGVVIGVTVLQPEGLGSIPLDSQNPPCWGALQQDMESYQLKGCSSEEIQFRLTLILTRKKNKNLAQLARCYVGQSNITLVADFVMWTLCFYFSLTMWRKINDCCRDNFQKLYNPEYYKALCSVLASDKFSDLKIWHSNWTSQDQTTRYQHENAQQKRGRKINVGNQIEDRY